VLLPLLPAVAPPGYYIVAGSSTLAECPDGWYKETWDRSNSCLKCGLNPFKEPDGAGGVIDGAADGWRSNRNVTIELLDPSFGTVLQREAVRGSPDCCCECFFAVFDYCVICQT
jgi:hypothetical protein